MDEHHSWYNGSVWHIYWPYQVHVGQRPIFYGPAILLHILKTIWWRNIVLGIMDYCDSKIDLVKLRNGTGRGYLFPFWAIALVFLDIGFQVAANVKWLFTPCFCLCDYKQIVCVLSFIEFQEYFTDFKPVSRMRYPTGILEVMCLILD